MSLIRKIQALNKAFALFLIVLMPVFSIEAQNSNEQPTILVTSSSFNAKSRSSIQIGKKIEHAKRGLTLVHILDKGDFENNKNGA